MKDCKNNYVEFSIKKTKNRSKFDFKDKIHKFFFC
jgi:hypothetical protein